MNRDRDTTTRLPEPVERYFREVATMEPPADLMDDVLERIEATPTQSRTLSAIVMPMAAAVLVLALIGAGIWALSPWGPTGVGGPDEDGAPQSAEPSPSPIPAASQDLDALPRSTYPTREVQGFDAYPFVAEGHGSLWMYRWDLNTVVRWDPSTGLEQSRIALGERDGARDHRDAAVLVSDGTVYVGDGADRILAIDPATDEASEFVTGVRPTHLATDGSTLWAVDLHGHEVVRYDLPGGEELARIPMPAQPTHLDVDADGDAWVVSPDGLLVRIDARTNEIAAEYSIGVNGNHVDVVDDAILISGQFRPLEQFSIAEERVVRMGARLGQVQAVANALVGFDRTGYVVFLDPESLAAESVIGVPPFDQAIIVRSGGGFWFGGNGDPNRALFVELDS